MSIESSRLNHVIFRIRERYGILVGKKFIYKLTKCVESKYSIEIKRYSPRKYLYLVRCSGMSFRVVYNKKKKYIHTVLPLEN